METRETRRCESSFESNASGLSMNRYGFWVTLAAFALVVAMIVSLVGGCS
jgi:heme exporter protein D